MPQPPDPVIVKEGLLSQEGIAYFFQHEDGKHDLVMEDQDGVYYDPTRVAVGGST